MVQISDEIIDMSCQALCPGVHEIMEPHFLSSERKLEPDGENRDLVFLLPWLPASQARRAIRAICLINYQTKNMRPPTSHTTLTPYLREKYMDIVLCYR